MAVFVLKRLPVRSTLERYQAQAARLITAFEASDAKAIQSIRQHHSRLPGRANTNDRNPITEQDIREAGLTATDAETVVASVSMRTSTTVRKAERSIPSVMAPRRWAWLRPASTPRPPACNERF